MSDQTKSSVNLGNSIDNILKQQLEYSKYDNNAVEVPLASTLNDLSHLSINKTTIQQGGSLLTKYIISDNSAVIFATGLIKAAHEAFDIVNLKKTTNTFILSDKKTAYYFIGNREVRNNINVDKIMLVKISSL
jgi:hypothetical protein